MRTPNVLTESDKKVLDYLERSQDIVGKFIKVDFIRYENTWRKEIVEIAKMIQFQEKS